MSAPSEAVLVEAEDAALDFRQLWDASHPEEGCLGRPKFSCVQAPDYLGQEGERKGTDDEKGKSHS